MSEDKIVASNLAAAFLRAGASDLAKSKNAPEAAAKLYFACFDALAAEAKKRPTNSPPLPAFCKY